MKLTSAQVTEFKSVRDSTPFDIGDITCLVGKNEAGKTAILQALYRVNPIIEEHAKFDITDDYPRADVEDYRTNVEKNNQKPATVIKATFTLSDEEISDIEEEFGKGILKTKELTLSRGYQNRTLVGLSIDEKVSVAKIIELAQLPNELVAELGGAKSIAELVKAYEAKTDDENKEHIERLKTVYKEYVGEKGVIINIYDTFLEENVPKFMYFDEYFMMKGYENIDALKERVQNKKLINSDYPLLGLIELARLDIDQLLNHQRTEDLVSKLEGAGNHLSKKVLQHWSQNKHVSMKFDVRPAKAGDPEGMTKGTNIWARVHDSKRQVSTLLGTRSRGFVWFFSFLAWFDQQKRNDEPLIILLDEPGLFLHGRAQGDLLDYIEKELKLNNHQVIYTTHSPFMVDPTKFDRVRIVQDRNTDSDATLPKDQDGTKVIKEIYEASIDSLFPLQGALGYDIYQTLFVGPNCLVVEGVSDLLYLQTISSLLGAQGREELNSKWTITPVGGSDKVPTFVALLGAQKGLKIATLIDIQKKDKQSIDNLFQKKLLEKQNVITFAKFTNSKEADIEDMFDSDFYINLVNEEYTKDLDKKIAAKDLDTKMPRILQKLNNYFENTPLKNGRQFSHYRPARYFSENIGAIKSNISEETLARFENCFKELNSLL